MGLPDDLASDDGSFVDVETAALVDDVTLDQPIDLEVSACGFRGFRHEAPEDRLARPLREEVPGHHPGHIAHAAVADEQVAPDEAGHRRRPRPDHDDGSFESLIEHAAAEDSHHARVPSCLTSESTSRFRCTQASDC